ncbi:GIY-YIG catalytic domain-containing protein [Salinimicrobium catena]|uniref:GIY-YIG catalytic domain-containing protein n=1 Tax=Salinimicrobium catena TaxID=390640 RepID=A0A1H5NPK2_9FLAO|nr:GIY-YIG nuclease family protein [Salinimicrobium catena]SDL55539.1 GIY-YIG catalytic domain-containing protein [Salinimicrobium catena]SEF03525.1 GIY-YIG catalytic domain-containing protein [Salinimicrobium catena]
MELPYAVYILKCSTGQYYIGFTEDIQKRLKKHQKGEVHFTKDKLPVELIHLSPFPDKKKACDFERYLKTGSGAAFHQKRLLKKSPALAGLLISEYFLTSLFLPEFSWFHSPGP